MIDFLTEAETKTNQRNKMTTPDDIEWVVTRTTTEVFMMVAGSAEDAEKLVAPELLVQRNVSSNVRPRNIPPTTMAKNMEQKPSQPAG